MTAVLEDGLGLGCGCGGCGCGSDIAARCKALRPLLSVKVRIWLRHAIACFVNSFLLLPLVVVAVVVVVVKVLLVAVVLKDIPFTLIRSVVLFDINRSIAVLVDAVVVVVLLLSEEKEEKSCRRSFSEMSFGGT